MAVPRYFTIASLAALLASFGLVYAQPPRTAADRVFSTAQAGRGQALYKESCASCHGDALQGVNGPPLTGSDFLAVWARQPLSDLVNKIKNTMPESNPGKLTRQQSADLVAHILQVGRFPAGQADLSVDEVALKLITIPPAAATASQPGPLAASHAPTFPPAGNMAQLMRGILFPSSNLIFNVQSYNPDDVKTSAAGAGGGGGFSWVDWGAGIYKPWELVDYAAVALAESAPLMLTPGRRCENGKPVPVDRPDWIAFTEELAAAGRAAYKASQTRNQEVVSDATNQIADACLHCHEVYRDRPARGAGPGSKANRCAIP
jgi:mono/diheme cytochrome c family protein